ncbi:hypothetical protein E2N92_11820 [Methanofollis formosanus]|uniref:Uncharacterized protein n=2 Tax=Methanofollis formosanus TaxID=299308 RepID=A0A8G1A447_9EURY|nr:hypothetical protein E2N92_11820 [Methanofollis formosanus]
MIVLLGMAMSCAGCMGEGAPAGVGDDLTVATQEEEACGDADTLATGESGDAEENSSSLAGTCPFGNHCCGSPGCSLWTDLNEDGRCDLGVTAE